MAIMFSSTVSFIPPTVALGIHFLMDYITFTNIGFVITIAILRLLFVIRVRLTINSGNESYKI